MQMKHVGKLGLAAVILLAAQACTRTDGEPNGPQNNGFAKLEVSGSFDWQNSKVITVNVTGLPTIEPVRSTLRISRHRGGNEDFYAGSHLMSENLQVVLRVPTAQDSLVLRFGTVQKTIAATASTVSVDYLPTIEPDIP